MADLQAELDRTRAELAVAKAQNADDLATITHQKLVIFKLQNELRGSKSERQSRLLDQQEFLFEEIEAAATEDELISQALAAKTTSVRGFERKSPAKNPFPDHLPRERVLVPSPKVCACCGGDRLRKLGEDITKSLDVIPRQFRVLEYVRERFSCRDCESFSQAPAPFHAIPRAWASPSLLAMILVEKFGHHKPLNRQLEQYKHEGVEIALSTTADAVGACCHTLKPLIERLEAYVFKAQRLHGDDTTIPVLAKGHTDTGRIWAYVRDDRPFGATSPPAAIFYYSRDRTEAHPIDHLKTWSGVFQADAYGGYNKLYLPDRKPGAILEAACWFHARRPFFAVANYEAAARRKANGKKTVPISPIGLEMVKRIDALFEIERGINGKSPEERVAVRQELSKPLIEDLKLYMDDQLARLSARDDLAKALNYMLKRWASFTRFLDDGRICLSNNAAERAVRGVALGRKSWLFAGSDRGGERAAAMYSLIYSAKLSGIDPQAWLADVLTRIGGHPNTRLDELLPWNWKLIKDSERDAA
ncbi:IS66 family transposase [Asticcacaulis sp. W401b]|uniref:IS66 family transposase n=2 Tax=Asticcacaulis sp. W401b TaxID=3388666 RepID=UPI003970D354